MKKLTMVKLGLLLLIAITILTSCGTMTNKEIADVTIMGYIKDATLKDAGGRIAEPKDASKGLYTFSSAIVYPITSTGGKLATTNTEYDINMSTHEGTVVSPITTIIGNNDMIENNLASTLGITVADLRSDYIHDNNLNITKLAQLCYIMLTDTNATKAFKTRVSTESSDNLSQLFDNAILDTNNSTNPATLQALLMRTKLYNGSANELEQNINIIKQIVSIPTFPLLNSFNTSGDTMKVTLSSDNTKAYISDGFKGFQIIDISSPTDITSLAKYDTDGFVYEIALSSDGTKAFLADSDAGLQIIDISTPANPTLLGSYDTTAGAEGVVLSDDNSKAFVADGADGLKIIDISTPTNPTLLGSYDTNNAHEIKLSSDGTKAFIADGSEGLKIIDISTPANPTLLGTYNTNGYAKALTLSSDNTKVYMADGTEGLKVIDISTPTNPTLVGSYDTDGYAKGITLSSDNTKAYIADDSKGLKIIDISTPTNPTLLGVHDTAGYAQGVTLSSDDIKAYVADLIFGVKSIYIGGY